MSFSLQITKAQDFSEALLQRTNKFLVGFGGTYVAFAPTPLKKGLRTNFSTKKFNFQQLLSLEIHGGVQRVGMLCYLLST